MDLPGGAFGFGLFDDLGGISAVTLFETGARRRIDARAWTDRVRERQTKHNGDPGDDERVGKRLQTDAPEFARIANRGHADDKRREDERNHGHQEQTEKQLTDWLRDVVDNPERVGCGILPAIPLGSGTLKSA